MTFVDSLSAALSRCPLPITARDLCAVIDDKNVDSSRVSKGLYQLIRTGRAEIVGEERPEGSKPIKLYVSLDPPTPDKSSVVAPQKQAPALDSSDWPDAVEEWPGDVAASLQEKTPPPQYDPDSVAFRHNDPTITEIEREGYGMLARIRHAAAMQQIEVLLQRVEAGVPFVGQPMPRYADAIRELCRANRELIANSEQREAA